MKLILRYLKPHWKLCLITIFFMIIDVIGALVIPTFAASMLNQGTASGADFSELINTCMKMLTAALISGAATMLGAYACSDLTSKVGADIRSDLYKKTLSLSGSDFRTFGTASVTTRTVSDITNIQFALLSCFQMLFPVPVIFIVSLVLTFRKDYFMGMILLGILLIIVIIAGIIMRSTAPMFRTLQKKLDRMSKVLLENITGVRVIRAFNKEANEEQRLNEKFEDYAQTAIKVNKRFAILDSISVFAINVFVMLVYTFSGFRITAGHFQIGDITAIIEYAMLSLFFLMMAQMVILTLPRALECCNRIGEIMDFSPTIADKKDRRVEEKKNQKEVLRFKNVSFRFADADEYTLKNLNFVCERGKTTAIIGGTGSGKSTVASLMMRFNEVTDGAVHLNGVDIRKMPQEQLREHLSFVQQRAWLFSGTIAENLRYGNPDADDKELWHALEIAQAKDFVEALPDKLDAFVAQGGTNFSGGQKQRLSIARALVKKPELYIFDDSFSALDFKTDAALRKALQPETKNAAVVIIAQRISTILHADHIIVLHEGEPVGMGKHEELLKNCPIYKEIYDSQTKEADEHE
ncbi:MAG: ABC transporter ATP-binding protein [bacterium]|nr:ABC transporter ATP-binding protein [bacterium]